LAVPRFALQRGARGLRSTINFLLYQWLDAEALKQRARFADHSRETFDATSQRFDKYLLMPTRFQ
jgi:hypothetical protein